MAAPVQDSGGGKSLAEEFAEITSKKTSDDDGWPTPVTKEETPTKAVETNEREKLPSRHKNRRDPTSIERANLMNVAKLLIKELIDSSLAHGRMLDDDHIPLQQFFVVLEHVLRHGLKAKKSLLSARREAWWVLEALERVEPRAGEITTSVRDMPHIRTPLGRARAWLRLALMQKTLADYFKLMVEHRDKLMTEFYEPGAFLLEEEGVVVAGLLVGLNVLDCNMCVKGEDLDQPMGVIDFSLYMKDGQYNDSDQADGGEGNSRMTQILDQKNYLEELNRHLNATVANLQARHEQVTADNCLLKEDLATTKNLALSLQEQVQEMKLERENVTQGMNKQMEAQRADIDTERETYTASRAGLDSMYAEMRAKCEEETRLRLDVEKELELQISMKTEMEVALRLLEQDIHGKQDTVIGLRQQLDDIKAINLELYNKLQLAEKKASQHQ